MKKRNPKLKTSVSLSKDLIEQGKIIGETEDRSFSWIVDRALRIYIDNQPKEGNTKGVKSSSSVSEPEVKTPSTPPPSLKVSPSPSPRRRRSVPQNPPTSDEVLTYMLSIGGTDKEAANFHDYWSDQGWTRNGGPMRDWKGSARMWHRNQRNNNRVDKSKESVARNYNFPADEHNNPRF